MCVAAGLFALQLVLAVTGLPGGLMEWLTGDGDSLTESPAYVVVLGGGGIPSESGLIRTYAAAEAGRNFPAAQFVVCLPADGDPETASVGRMRDELVLRGIARDAVLMEHRGRNTHEQALAMRRMLGDAALDMPVLIVTSPTHVRRALLCFRKEGFRRVGALAASGVGAEADLGGYTLGRYSFWSGLSQQAEVARELVALLVYALRGWV